LAFYFSAKILVFPGIFFSYSAFKVAIMMIVDHTQQHR